MLLLDNPIQPYDWGPLDGLASLVGLAASGEPQAELWVGTHERGPSVVAHGPLAGVSLAEVISRDPERYLGAALVERGHDRLPFLMKVLAIGSSLSLQAHPSTEQAVRGFAREEAAGLPVDDATRSYRDPRAKPEALVALTETFALCGFRPTARSAALVRSAGRPELAPLAAALEGPDGLRAALTWLLRCSGPARREVAAAARVAAGALATRDRLDPWAWVRHLADQHDGDPTCVAPLLLEVVRLAPGDGIHLPAGNLHAYLSGGGVEIMGASDNVLRGGLTSKHVDVEELLHILDLDPGVPAAPATWRRGGWTVHDAGEEDFALARLDAGTAAPAGLPGAPSLLLALGAPATVEASGFEELRVDPGRAVFVEAGASVTVRTGGDLWWATTGRALRR